MFQKFFPRSRFIKRRRLEGLRSSLHLNALPVLAQTGLCWRSFFALVGVLCGLGRSWGGLGAVLGRLGRSWGGLGAVLGGLGCFCGGLGAVLGPSWVVLGAILSSKTLIFLVFFNIF